MFSKLNQQLQGRWECQEDGNTFYFSFKPSSEFTFAGNKSDTDIKAFTEGHGGYFSTNALTETGGDYRLIESVSDAKHTLKTQGTTVYSQIQMNEFELTAEKEMIMYISGFDFKFTKVTN